MPGLALLLPLPNKLFLVQLVLGVALDDEASMRMVMFVLEYTLMAVMIDEILAWDLFFFRSLLSSLLVLPFFKDVRSQCVRTSTVVRTVRSHRTVLYVLYVVSNIDSHTKCLSHCKRFSPMPAQASTFATRALGDSIVAQLRRSNDGDVSEKRRLRWR